MAASECAMPLDRPISTVVYRREDLTEADLKGDVMDEATFRKSFDAVLLRYAKTFRGLAEYDRRED